MSFGDPLAGNVSEQLPVPLVSVPVHPGPVVLDTVTVPLGVPVPVTLNDTVTAWLIVEGFGEVVVIVVVLEAVPTVIATESVAAT